MVNAMNYRIFHHQESTRGLDVTDAELVREGDEFDVYHTEDENIEAIKYSKDGDVDKILLADDKVKTVSGKQVCRTDISHIREKEHKFEQYIVGFGYYATSCDVGFFGETNKEVEHEWKETCVRIGSDTVVVGQSGYDNKWDWQLKETISDVRVWMNQDALSDALGGDKCVVVASDSRKLKPIDIFYRVSD
jgi:hypothetical protein